jgi:phosphate transport system substrate-binding protein
VIRKICALFLIAAVLGGCGKQGGDGADSGTISISGAWALYPLVVKWAEEYMKLNPGLRIEVSAGGAGKGMSDVLADMTDIGMISREINEAEIGKGIWWIPVAKDAVIPTLNEKNPYFREILARGVPRETLQKVWINKSAVSWESVLQKQGNTAIHVYTRSDACGAAQVWAQYLGGNQEDLAGVGVYGDPGLAEAVKQDNLGIGYNNINYAYDPQSGKVIRGLAVLPIDLDNSGRIEAKEDFYGTRDRLLAAISRGDYPSPPARNLYFACNGKPGKKELAAFITWILTDGQRYIDLTGYIPVAEADLRKALDSLK